MGRRGQSPDQWVEGPFAPVGQDEMFRGAHEDRHKGSVTVAMTTCSDSV